MPVIATIGGEGTPLIACHIGHFEGGEFLDVYGRLEFLYIFKGYDELYEDIQAFWKTDGANKVVLVGNAGTGKSWYQLYILMQLLKHSIVPITRMMQMTTILFSVRSDISIISLISRTVWSTR